jgi:hypothetical protein
LNAVVDWLAERNAPLPFSSQEPKDCSLRFNQPDQNRVLQELLPYRMQAVTTLNLALRLRSQWDDAPPMEIHADGKLVVEGNLNAFTNPAIEAGAIHCRALLEFLGLGEKDDRLVNRKGRRLGDIGIEHFEDANGSLAMLDPEVALSRYDGGRDEAEKALLAVFQLTNKGLAHVTQDLTDHPDREARLEIASRGIPSLIVSYLYTPLGLPAPDYKLSARRR